MYMVLTTFADRKVGKRRKTSTNRNVYPISNSRFQLCYILFAVAKTENLGYSLNWKKKLHMTYDDTWFFMGDTWSPTINQRDLSLMENR